MWIHFESIHIIHQPTYISKYPPGQGVALALGQLIWKPEVGVWLSTAMACVAIYWMMLAWLPMRWAILGGLLGALHPQMITWSQNYWGGAVAVMGGSLVAGGFRRLVDNTRVQDALAMGLGMMILANTRPYEGFVLSSLFGLAMLLWLVGKKRPPFPDVLKKVVLPLAAMMILIASQVGYYNFSTTGNPLRMPYTVHEKTYGATPLFLWQEPPPMPEYRHKAIHDLQAVEYLGYFQSQRTPGGLLQAIGSKLFTLGQGVFWSGLLLVPMLGLPWALKRDGWTRSALGIISLFSFSMLLGTWVFTHYAAPVSDLFLMMVLQSMRQLRLWRFREQRSGLLLARGTLVVCFLSVLVVAVRLKRDDPSDWHVQRLRIINELSAQPGKHLLLVRYGPNHNPNREWVYNPADLNSSPVLLAREMGAGKDQELLDYYKDRKVWLVQADAPLVTPVLLRE
jgi:hypothetical protein